MDNMDNNGNEEQPPQPADGVQGNENQDAAAVMEQLQYLSGLIVYWEQIRLYAVAEQERIRSEMLALVPIPNGVAGSDEDYNSDSE